MISLSRAANLWMSGFLDSVIFFFPESIIILSLVRLVMFSEKIPKISVIIIAHERENFISNAINSVNEQTSAPDEIIVIKSFKNTEID